MLKLLNRIVALVLVAALAVDPALANSLRLRSIDERSAAAGAFEIEALASRPATIALHRKDPAAFMFGLVSRRLRPMLAPAMALVLIGAAGSLGQNTLRAHAQDEQKSAESPVPARPKPNWIPPKIKNTGLLVMTDLEGLQPSDVELVDAWMDGANGDYILVFEKRLAAGEPPHRMEVSVSKDGKTVSYKGEEYDVRSPPRSAPAPDARQTSPDVRPPVSESPPQAEEAPAGNESQEPFVVRVVQSFWFRILGVLSALMLLRELILVIISYLKSRPSTSMIHRPRAPVPRRGPEIDNRTRTGIAVPVFDRAFTAWLAGQPADLDEETAVDEPSITEQLRRTGTFVIPIRGRVPIVEVREHVKNEIGKRHGESWLHVDYRDHHYVVTSDVQLVRLRPEDDERKSSDLRQRLGSALDALLGPGASVAQRFDPARVWFFKYNEGAKLTEYVDSDFWRDMVREMGEKSRSANLTELLRQYLTRVYDFELSEDSNTMLKALHELGDNHYKFAKAVELGRVKLESEGKLYADEIRPIPTLHPNEYAFRVAGSAHVQSEDQFIRAVLEHGGRSLENGKSPLLIYHKIWKGPDGRWFILVGRNGRLELYYSSNTYSEVAGQLQWQRQEGVMAYLDRRGRLHLSWFMKPKVENAHELSDAASQAINTALAAAVQRDDVYLPRPEHPEEEAELSLLHVKLGLAFAVDGEAMSLDPFGNPQYGNRKKLRIDARRYPAWTGVALATLQRANDDSLQRRWAAYVDRGSIRYPRGQLPVLDAREKIANAWPGVKADNDASGKLTGRSSLVEALPWIKPVAWYYPFVALLMSPFIALKELAHLAAAPALGLEIVDWHIGWTEGHVTVKAGRPWQNALFLAADPIVNIVAALGLLWRFDAFSPHFAAFLLFVVPVALLFSATYGSSADWKGIQRVFRESIHLGDDLTGNSGENGKMPPADSAKPLSGLVKDPEVSAGIERFVADFSAMTRSTMELNNPPGQFPSRLDLGTALIRLAATFTNDEAGARNFLTYLTHARENIKESVDAGDEPSESIGRAIEELFFWRVEGNENAVGPEEGPAVSYRLGVSLDPFSEEDPPSFTLEPITREDRNLILGWREVPMLLPEWDAATAAEHPVPGYMLIAHWPSGERSLEGWISYQPTRAALDVPAVAIAPVNRGPDGQLRGVATILLSRVIEKSIELGYNGRLTATPGGQEGRVLFDRLGALPYRGAPLIVDASKGIQVIEENERRVITPVIARSILQVQRARAGVAIVDRTRGVESAALTQEGTTAKLAEWSARKSGVRKWIATRAPGFGVFLIEDVGIASGERSSWLQAFLQGRLFAALVGALLIPLSTSGLDALVTTPLLIYAVYILVLFQTEFVAYHNNKTWTQVIVRWLGTFLLLNGAAVFITRRIAAALLPSFSQHPIYYVLAVILAAMAGLVASGLTHNGWNRFWQRIHPQFILTRTPTLTRGQKQIIGLAMQGKKDKEIAQTLFLSTYRIKNQFRSARLMLELPRNASRRLLFAVAVWFEVTPPTLQMLGIKDTGRFRGNFERLMKEIRLKLIAEKILQGFTDGEIVKNLEYLDHDGLYESVKKIKTTLGIENEAHLWTAIYWGALWMAGRIASSGVAPVPREDPFEKDQPAVAEPETSPLFSGLEPFSVIRRKASYQAAWNPGKLIHDLLNSDDAKQFVGDPFLSELAVYLARLEAMPDADLVREFHVKRQEAPQLSSEELPQWLRRTDQIEHSVRYVAMRVEQDLMGLQIPGSQEQQEAARVRLRRSYTLAAMLVVVFNRWESRAKSDTSREATIAGAFVGMLGLIPFARVSFAWVPLHQLILEHQLLAWTAASIATVFVLTWRSRAGLRRISLQAA